jgi:hypothetical protein
MMMSTKQIKLNAIQAGPITKRQNLLDFVIPSGSSYDLEKSYINLVASIKGESLLPNAVYNYKLTYQFPEGNAGDREACYPNSAFVRNCSMKSANKGMLESINRVDVLSTNLSVLRQSVDDRDGSLYKTVLPHKTRSLELITPFRQLRGEGTEPSKEITSPIQIKLKDLFGLGKSVISTEYLGETRIHLETSPERFVPTQLFPLVDDGDFATILYQQMEDVVIPQATVDTLESKMRFQRLEDSPYWVNMAITITSEYVGIDDDGNPLPAVAKTHETTISGLSYVRNGDDKGKLIISLATPLPDPVVGGGGSYSSVLINGHDALTTEFEIEYAEIMLQETTPMPMPDEMSYMTYTSQETNVNGLLSYQEQFIVEPNAFNLLAVALIASDVEAQSGSVESFRVRINGVDATDRDVEINSPLYYDRLSMYMLNANETLRSLLLVLPHSIDDTNKDRYSSVNIRPMVTQPLPITTGSKIVDLTLNNSDDSVGKVILFKSVLRKV